MKIGYGMDNVLLNFERNQQDLAKTTSQLSSGLRIQSAADDPSGLAIAENLTTKVNGLQQSVNNVQTAHNLLDVADGALAETQTILQRIRSLIVESRSDINSQSDLQNIQAEIDQMLTEINRIGANTNFNGLNLFNGQFDNGLPNPTPYGAQQVSNFILAPGGYLGSDQVSNATGPGSGPGPLVTITGPGVSGPGSFTPALMFFQVIGADPVNAVDPDTGTSVGPGVYVLFEAFSPNASLGSAPTFKDVSAVPINAGQISSTYTTPASWALGPVPGNQLITFTLANLTLNDVGVTQAFITTNGSQSNPGAAPLTVNDGGNEGSTIGINIPTISTNALDLTGISVLPTSVINYLNQPQGQDPSNLVPAGAAEIRTDAALDQISIVRAQIGAQMVATQEDSNNDNIAIINYTASESSIRDLNVGAATTQFTKEQILTEIGTSVLSQYQVDARQLTSLLINALVA
jgi:flagellin